VKNHNNYNSNTLINPSNENTVAGNFALGYITKNNFGLLVSLNLSEYWIDSATYYRFARDNYPTCYTLSTNTSPFKQYNLKLGVSYSYRVSRFEFVPAIMAGRYVKFEPVKGEIILKEDGSNKTRELIYDPVKTKNLVSVSGALITKFNFKFGLGFHVMLEYSVSKPLIEYTVYEKEYMQTVNKGEYHRRINLSRLDYLFGIHYNFRLRNAGKVAE
jgi:hypothetical protein